MKKTLHLACIGALLPIVACSESLPSPEPAAASTAAVDASPAVGPCATDEGSPKLVPLPALGPDFSDSSIEMFAVEGGNGAPYLSRPQAMAAAGSEATLRLAYAPGQDGELQLTVCLASGQGRAHSPPIGSQGGAHPVVAATFMANADAEPGQELVVLVSWSVENALGTAGTMYEPHVFKMPGDAGALQRVQLDDPALSFGFDGVREGEQVAYPYREARAFRARLQALGFTQEAP
ncbi:hypothetical protein [Marilutibacter aestuarii]|uniref:Uncharacterized protein n=1 Tax=Marilutibacter aestuarii TaxID=1706195 RepID=A0A508A9V8_9GAMM|nr:hypothetical protein [Lysobacter aestuarii]TQD45683.1 hypothetical protein FKV25_07590 [Lysobacter aestuarii]